MLLTTASLVGDKQIVDRLGIVSSEALLRVYAGGNMRSESLEKYKESLREAKKTVIEEMVQQAKALGANAVIGIDIDYGTINIGNGGSMLMVAVSGTAERCV